MEGEHGDDPVMVTAMLAALSTARRGRRADSRSPSSSGTGSPADSAISLARRRGGRAVLASTLTVLVRAARTAGTSVAASATATATPTTSAAAGSVSDGAPGAPTRPAPGLVISGAASQPADQSGGRGTQRQEQVLGQQHGRDQARGAADRLEQPDPPGVLRHPATGQHGHAGHGQQPGQPGTGNRTCRSSATSRPSAERCPATRSGTRAERAAAGEAASYRRRTPRPGRVAELQVQRRKPRPPDPPPVRRPRP